MVENGGTVVLGGIYQQSERNNETKVPLLGDVPVLGYLFKTTGAHQHQDRTAGVHHAEDRRRPRAGAIIEGNND